LSGVSDAIAAAFADRRDDLVAEFEAEASKLEAAGNRLARLLEAESNEQAAVSRAKDIGKELLAFPAEHQVRIDDAQGALDAQMERLELAREERDIRRNALARLQENAKRRSELEQRRAASARSGTVAGRLERLLGRSGLQGALLNQAVGGVEDLANETLSRLTGGALSVSLAVDETTDAGKVEILVTDAASADEPLEAVFVSGSQRFRVAVALAAGLGQYLGGPEAVRALIIDEGFGSLDESGRDEMIAELHNLAEHLDRVIVVSHHSDFSDPARFPQGFKLRKVGRHTEVSRMM
jgi:DNA repair exonuclease SbcCD ATPase subunit